MRSGLGAPLTSFGTIFLSFGAVILLLGFLGVHFGAHEQMNRASLVGLAMVVVGAVLFGAGFAFGGMNGRERTGTS